MKIKEVEELVGVSTTYELKPDARYLIVVEGILNLDRLFEYQEWLNSHGVDCVVVNLDCRLFEIEKEVPDSKCSPGSASIKCAFCDAEASFIINRTATCVEHRSRA